MYMIESSRQLLIQFGRDERGVTTVEYAIMLVLIAIAVAAYWSGSVWIRNQRFLAHDFCADPGYLTRPCNGSLQSLSTAGISFHPAPS